MSEHFDAAEDREDEEPEADDSGDDPDEGGNPWAKTSSGDADDV